MRTIPSRQPVWAVKKCAQRSRDITIILATAGSRNKNSTPTLSASSSNAPLFKQLHEAFNPSGNRGSIQDFQLDGSSAQTRTSEQWSQQGRNKAQIQFDHFMPVFAGQVVPCRIPPVIAEGAVREFESGYIFNSTLEKNTKPPHVQN